MFDIFKNKEIVVQENNKQYLRTREVCEFLGINRNTFYTLVKNKILPMIDLKGGKGKRKTYRISRKSLLEYLDSLKNPIPRSR
ncbi:MAG: helix-turn-helix domain-containing protein [Sulfurovaceae bacterium]|nr:helix-turn-helix domain-containing protein [Sulfurovaceae bacterium]